MGFVMTEDEIATVAAQRRADLVRRLTQALHDDPVLGHGAGCGGEPGGIYRAAAERIAPLLTETDA